MKGWKLKRIDELGKVITGKTPSCDNPDEFGNTYPFITPTDIPNTQKVVRVERFLSEIGKESHKRIMLPPKTTCVVCIGATIGKTCMSQESSFTNQQINSIIANQDNDKDYIYYTATTLKDALVSFAGGAATPIVNKSIFSSIKVNIPLLPIQRKIAAVLSAYDDLIENNNRRIAILEKMAEELYREWFVRLRFPGHEKVKIVKGVPEEWEVKRIGEVIEYYIGGGWGDDNEDINHPIGAFVIRGTDIPNLKSGKFDEPPFRFHKTSNYESRKMKVGDIVFEVSGGSKDQLLGRALLITKGILKLCNGTLICASFCKLIRPAISPLFINNFLQAYYASGLVDTFQIQSTGISNYQFESFIKYQTIIIPPSPVLNRFDSYVEKLIEEKDALSTKNRLLTDSRARLLTRLMSGKIDVENLDIKFPASMKEEAANA